MLNLRIKFYQTIVYLGFFFIFTTSLIFSFQCTFTPPENTPLEQFSPPSWLIGSWTLTNELGQVQQNFVVTSDNITSSSPSGASTSYKDTYRDSSVSIQQPTNAYLIILNNINYQYFGSNNQNSFEYYTVQTSGTFSTNGLTSRRVFYR